MNEYIVTCKNRTDLQDLYDDLETPGGSFYIPDRTVDLVSRREISRNTHYMLTEEEAVEIRKDSRVIACERPAQDRGITPEYLWEQTGYFNKTTSTFLDDDKNWGLYRTIKGDSVYSWGSDATTRAGGTIATSVSGKNVDVVVVDGHINPNHIEFAANSDGTGVSRVVQFNWYQYNSVLGYGSNGTYTYSTSGSSPNTNHGTHVAGTVAGNTQGWARDSNIYNMAFSDSLSGSYNWSEKMWDYLRHFHKNKDINPATGRRNPTITNHSWGYNQGSPSLSSISSVNYQGVVTTVTGSSSERRAILESNGIPVPASTYLYRVPARNVAVDADIQDAIDDGVIVISSAGNSYWNCAVSGDVNYNNTFVRSGSTAYHSRGSSPGSADNVICVGSIGSKDAEYKSNFSNWGSRVDIWAPGSDIISSVYDSASATSEGGYTPIVADSRNSSYYLASISGTSMSSPQVCGVIACIAQNKPNITNSEALQYLKENSLPEIGSSSGSENNDYETFGSTSHNRYLFIKRKRKSSGSLQQTTFGNRNADVSGVKYPRTNRSFTK
jgi:hypothetical protein